MVKEFTHKGWGRGAPASRGTKKSNKVQASKKRLTNEDSNSISESEETSMKMQTKAKPEVTGPTFYRCLSSLVKRFFEACSLFDFLVPRLAGAPRPHPLCVNSFTIFTSLLELICL